MLLVKNFQVALRALAANKMRSSLTMLGIIIGVAAVVALLSIGNGATTSITSEISSLGANLVTISPGRAQFGPGGQSTTDTLYSGDYAAIASQVRNVSGLAPVYQTSYLVRYNRESTRVSVSGVTRDYFAVHAYTIAAGRALNENDQRTQARAAVLGAQTSADLFGTLSPLGKVIKINGVRFDVVGVLQSKGGRNGDDLILIPLETGYAKLFGSAAVKNGQPVLSSIAVSASSADSVDSVMAQIDRVVRREHRLTATEEADFSVSSQSDFLDSVSTVSATLTIFLGAVAGLSLLVGGIGIMNIMLVSVTERTKEIGLRKAVGARQEQILMQFLIETVTLSVLGGGLGIALGVGIAVLSTALGLITAQVSANSIVLAFGFAVAIGVFFGLYPAYRAARLHPIQALRSE